VAVTAPRVLRPQSAGPRLLVLRALGLGDLLAGVPAIRALRRAFDRQWLVLATPPALAPLALLTGAVDEVLPYSAPETGPWPPLPWPGGPPDLAVNLHGRGPQSHRALLELRPRRVWGFPHSSFPGVSGPAWPDAGHEVARWCGLLAHHLVPADPNDLSLPRPADRAPPRPGAIVIHPGARYEARRWPPDRFAAIAAALRDAGHPVVVSGGAAERPLAVAVADQAGLDRADVLAGRTDTLDLAALVATARLVVCGDTGVGHLATAYGTPSVLLFGPVPPDEWGPPAGRRQHAVLWHDAAPTDPRDSRPSPALLQISVRETLDAVATLLEGDAEPPAVASRTADDLVPGPRSADQVPQTADRAAAAP
jgi:ADP-heptose:LPS heptosyltransferase